MCQTHRREADAVIEERAGLGSARQRHDPQ
jgi:hypothetical protein